MIWVTKTTGALFKISSSYDLLIRLRWKLLFLSGLGSSAGAKWVLGRVWLEPLHQLDPSWRAAAALLVSCYIGAEQAVEYICCFFRQTTSIKVQWVQRVNRQLKWHLFVIKNSTWTILNKTLTIFWGKFYYIFFFKKWVIFLVTCSIINMWIFIGRFCCWLMGGTVSNFGGVFSLSPFWILKQNLICKKNFVTYFMKLGFLKTKLQFLCLILKVFLNWFILFSVEI